MTIRRIAAAVRTAFTTTGRHQRNRVGNALSVARRYAVLDALVTRHNEGIVTAGQYLTQVLGADAEFSARFDSPFGKKIKAAYIALHGENPPKIRLVTERRRLHRAIGYLLGALALLVAVGMYDKTAALLNGAS